MFSFFVSWTPAWAAPWNSNIKNSKLMGTCLGGALRPSKCLSRTSGLSSQQPPRVSRARPNSPSPQGCTDVTGSSELVGKQSRLSGWGLDVDLALWGKPCPVDTAGWGEDRWCPGKWGIMIVRAGLYFRTRTPGLGWAAGRAGQELRAQPGKSEGCGQDRDLEGKL